FDNHVLFLVLNKLFVGVAGKNRNEQVMRAQNRLPGNRISCFLVKRYFTSVVNFGGYRRWSRCLEPLGRPGRHIAARRFFSEFEEICPVGATKRIPLEISTS